jgi:hypothetical protein
MTIEQINTVRRALDQIVEEKAPEIARYMKACGHGWGDIKEVTDIDIVAVGWGLITQAVNEMLRKQTHTCCATGGLQVSITEWGTGRVTYQVLYSPCLYHRSL